MPAGFGSSCDSYDSYDRIGPEFNNCARPRRQPRGRRPGTHLCVPSKLEPVLRMPHIVNGVTQTWIVEPSGPLRGDISVRGSKNAVTKHMVAAMLGDGASVIRNAPQVGDVDITAAMLGRRAFTSNWMTPRSRSPLAAK